jgi:serine/threonine protein kinase
MSGFVFPLLRNGDEFRLRETGQKGKVIGEIGVGGQGQVFKARMDDGTEKALKVYDKHYLIENSWLQTKIPALVQRGAPSDRFLWPEGTVQIRKDRELFGYIMPMRPDGYIDASVLLYGQARITKRALLRAAAQISRSFEALHSRGLFYRDLNWNNVAIHPENGDVRIVDNDNVDFDSEEDQVRIGFPSFIAPEVLRGESRPSSDSDRHSLAVLYYLLFFKSHPLEGKAVLSDDCDIWGVDAQNKIYANSPYHFDPDDKSNEALPESDDDPDGLAGAIAIRNRQIYPAGFLKHFDETFTKGLKKKHLRTMENVWGDAFDELEHQIILCRNQSCQDSELGARENFYQGERVHHCYQCGQEIELPPRMRVMPDKRVMVLTHDIQLRGRHIGERSDRSQRDQVHGGIDVNPTDPEKWGLRNDTNVQWKVQNEPGGPWVEIPSGKRVALSRRKIVVDFGNGRKGIIRRGAPGTSETTTMGSDSR